MHVVRFQGESSSARATWREMLEESKKDMGLLDQFSGASGVKARRRTVLKLWNQSKVEAGGEPFAFEEALRETGS
jgi:hypothetical protein